MITGGADKYMQETAISCLCYLMIYFKEEKTEM